MTFLRIVIALYLFCLSMISAQTLRVCREGKPVSTFPDHALCPPEIARLRPRQRRLADARIGGKTTGEIIQSGQFAAAAELDQRDLLRGARLETHRRACRNIKPHVE